MRRDLAIIGPGKVGTAIGILAARAGWCVKAVGGRDLARAKAAAQAISPEARGVSPTEAAGAAGLVLLTVSDDAISNLCRELASARAFEKGAIVAHCSGGLSSSELASAREAGCAVASCHPLQTFPNTEAAMNKISGAFFFCEGDEHSRDVLETLVVDIGGKFIWLAGAQGKALYHAAAAMACNYMTSLADAALWAMGDAGISSDDALAALGPLMRATADNIASLGPADALTGPIARGDVKTVAKHVQAMAGREDLLSFYCAAGIWTVQLARRSGKIDIATADALMGVLKGNRM